MTGQGMAAIDGMVTQQAAVMAYSNAFLAMTFVSLAAFPLLALIRGGRKPRRRRRRTLAHAVMD